MSKLPRFRRLQPAVILALGLLAGCASTKDASMEDPRAEGLERWKCGDYYDGCGLLGTNCPVTLTADVHNGTGTVKFAGTVERTNFKIRGVSRRWDWCLKDSGFECAFVISAEGGGRYYDFAGANGRVKPTDVFKCTKS